MDALFKALADPARRAILDMLRANDGATLGMLERGFEMSRFGVMKHLRVLEEAGLITTVKRGRFKHHYLNVVPLQDMADRWIDPLLAQPAARGLLSLKAHLERTDTMLDTAKPTDFTLETFIRCSPEALWRALTDADEMAAYHFACSRVEGEAVEGAGIAFLREDGSVMLRQRVLSVDPGARLETTFEPQFGGSETPSRVSYAVTAEGQACKLSCHHYDLPPEQDGVREGWARWAASLKSWLETGQPIKLG